MSSCSTRPFGQQEGPAGAALLACGVAPRERGHGVGQQLDDQRVRRAERSLAVRSDLQDAVGDQQPFRGLQRDLATGRVEAVQAGSPVGVGLRLRVLAAQQQLFVGQLAEHDVVVADDSLQPAGSELAATVKQLR